MREGSGTEPRYELEPAQVAEKLTGGMKRNAQAMCRITGGEPLMWYEHILGVIDEFLERTKGVRMHLPEVTDVAGEPLGIIIETNGSLLDAKRLDAMERRWGEEAARVVISIGFKATHPEALAKLTGLALPVAARAHQKQLDALLHIVLNTEHLAFCASFLDKYTDPGIYAAIERECERARPGAGRNFSVQRVKRYGNANKYGTPKRFRGKEFPEPSPEVDEEIITELIDPDGGIEEALEQVHEIEAELERTTDLEKRAELEGDLEVARELVPASEPQPVEHPEPGVDEMYDLRQEFAETMQKREGRSDE